MDSRQVMEREEGKTASGWKRKNRWRRISSGRVEAGDGQSKEDWKEGKQDSKRMKERGQRQRDRGQRGKKIKRRRPQESKKQTMQLMEGDLREGQAARVWRRKIMGKKREIGNRQVMGRGLRQQVEEIEEQWNQNHHQYKRAGKGGRNQTSDGTRIYYVTDNLQCLPSTYLTRFDNNVGLSACRIIYRCDTTPCMQKLWDQSTGAIPETRVILCAFISYRKRSENFSYMQMGKKDCPPNK